MTPPGEVWVESLPNVDQPRAGYFYLVNGTVQGIKYPIVEPFSTDLLRVIGSVARDVYSYNTMTREFDKVVPEDMDAFCAAVAAAIGSARTPQHDTLANMREDIIAGKIPLV